MKECGAKKEKIVFAKAFAAAATSLPETRLRASVRRAVKKTPVPADLEAKVRKLLREQF